MMGKRNYILIGLLFVCIAMACYAYIGVQSFHDQHLNKKVLLGLASAFCISLGLSEAMFIRAQIVPKWLRLLFYFQWIVSGVAILTTSIYLLCGGSF